MSTRISTAVRVDTSAGKAVSPVCYGWHYEEIGMIGDGGPVSYTHLTLPTIA